LEETVFDETTKKKVTRSLSLGSVLPECAKCPRSNRPKLGCHRFGHSFVASHPIRIAKEPKPTARGVILCCPRSVEQPILEAACWEALAIERDGGLHAAYMRPLVHLWARTVAFYREVIAARDNYLTERGA
jgi:hypothetical protein